MKLSKPSLLWQVLKEAAATPSEANLSQLLTTLDQTVVKLATAEQLQVVSDAFPQIVEVFQERAAIAFDDLDAATSNEGPVMPADAFDRYVRQTMVVDFDQFIELPDPSTSNQNEEDFSVAGLSVAGEVDKVALLRALDTEMRKAPHLNETEIFNKTLTIAHEEDFSSWIEAITQWLNRVELEEIQLLQIQQATGMSLVQLWLSLLLGGFTVEQRGEFYDPQSIWVAKPVS